MRTLATYAFASIVALFGIGAGTATYEFGIGGKPLICVPENDVPNYNRSLTQSSLFLIPEESPLELLTFQYNASELVRAIPGFHTNRGYNGDDPPNTLFGDISLVRKNYKSTSLGIAAGPDVEKIWNRTGACREPVIANVPGSSTYLAKCDRENFWHILFDRSPGAEPRPRNLYDSVLAECTHTSVGFGPHKGAELENCKRRIIIENFRVDYEFQIENAGVIPKMDSFLRSRINFWNRNCDTLAAR